MQLSLAQNLYVVAQYLQILRWSQDIQEFGRLIVKTEL